LWHPLILCRGWPSTAPASQRGPPHHCRCHGAKMDPARAQKRNSLRSIMRQGARASPPRCPRCCPHPKCRANVARQSRQECPAATRLHEPVTVGLGHFKGRCPLSPLIWGSPCLEEEAANLRAAAKRRVHQWRPPCKRALARRRASREKCCRGTAVTNLGSTIQSAAAVDPLLHVGAPADGELRQLEGALLHLAPRATGSGRGAGRGGWLQLLLREPSPWPEKLAPRSAEAPPSTSSACPRL